MAFDLGFARSKQFMISELGNLTNDLRHEATMSNDKVFRVLIIEDSPEDAATFQRFLEKGSDAFRCRHAATAEAGLTALREEATDCLLLDYNLPDLNGLEVLAVLQSNAQLLLPVIMLTGSGDEQVAVSALKAGALDYLIKDTLSAEQLRRTVVNAVERWKLMQNLDKERLELAQQNAILKQTEAALRESQNQLSFAFEAGGLGFWHVSLPDFVLTSSERCREDFGVSPQQEFDYSMLLEMIHPEDRVHQKTLITNAFETGQAYSTEYRIITPQGELRWIDARGRVMLDGDGQIQAFSGTTQDITERKSAEDLLKKSEARYRRILKQSHAGIVEADASGGITLVNERWCEMFGYSEAEMLELNIIGLTHPTSLEITLEAVGRLAAGGPDFQIEKNYLRKDGSMLMANSSVSAVRGPGGEFLGLVAVVLDVTKLKNQQESLFLKNLQLELALDSSSAGTWSWDSQNNVWNWDDRYHALYGLPQDTPRSFETWLNSVHTDDKSGLQARLTELLEPGTGDIFHEEFRILHPKNGERWMLGLGRIERNPEGKAVRFAGINLDITERKTRELNLAFLAELEQTLTPLLSSSEMMKLAGSCIANYLKLSHCLFVEINQVTDEATVLYDHRSSELRSLEGVYQLDDYHTTARRQRLAAGHSVILGDIAQEVEVPQAANFEALGIRAQLDTPYVSDGRWKFVLSAAHAQPHQWREDERALLTELTARIWTRLERMRIEEHMRQSEESYHTLFDSIDEGYCIIEILFDDAGHAHDYRFLEVNPSFEKHTGFKDGVGKTIKELVPAFEQDWVDIYSQVALTGEARRLQQGSLAMGRFFDVYAVRLGGSGSHKVAVVFNDITERARAEEAVRVSEERLSLAIEGAQIGTFDWNIQSGDIHWSQAIEASMAMVPGTFGNSFDAFINYVHPEDREHVKTQIEIALQTGDYECEFRMLKPDGKPRWVIGRGQVYFTATGEPNRMVGVDIDITERKSAEQRAQQLQTVSAVLGSALTPAQVYEVVLREGASTMGANGGTLHLLDNDVLKLTGSRGFTQELVEGYQTISLESALPVARTALTREAIWLRSKADYKVQYPNLADQLEVVKFEAVLTLPIIIKDLMVGVLSFTFHEPQTFDAVERWFYYTLASMTAQALERTQLYQELVVSDESLREADRRKDEFLAVLAHELRNPLAPIRTSLEIMRLSKDVTMHQEAMEIIDRQSQQMVHLVDDLLDVSRIRQGSINLDKEKLTLNEVVAMAVESTRPLIEDRGHRLELALPETTVHLFGDKTRLTQIMLNLLANAAKYTPSGGAITLKANREKDDVVLIVQDTGIGLPAEMLTKVFDMFIRVEREESYQQQGLGIGLNLVKQLVELHGGTVSASSAGEGRGSTFTVRLPIADEAPSAPEKPVTPDQAPDQPTISTSRRVLVVDDYEANLRTLSRMLRLMGHEVATAEDGKRALECLDVFQPDLILLDINMPGMTGYEVAGHIRQNQKHQAVRLIALTGYGQAEDIERAKVAGFDDHIVKPVEIARLEALLEQD